MRAIQATPATPPPASDPAWMAPFLDSLAREDLAPATLRGYRYDLRHFLAWHATVRPDPFALDHPSRETTPATSRIGATASAASQGAWSLYAAADGGREDGWRPQSGSSIARAYADLGWRFRFNPKSSLWNGVGSLEAWRIIPPPVSPSRCFERDFRKFAKRKISLVIDCLLGKLILFPVSASGGKPGCRI